MDKINSNLPGSETQNILQLLLEVFPYLRQILGEDSLLTLSDTQKHLFVSQGKKIQLPIQAGDLIKEGSITHASISTGNYTMKKIPSEVYGISYIGKAIPVRDDANNLMGSINMAIPIETQEKVSNMACDLNNNMDKLSIIGNDFMSVSEQLAATAQELANSTTGIDRDIKDMDTVITLIKEVSDQTHLLGLNASIEAARAGDQGRGFNVVAEEIRKLASRTNNSVKEISNKLKNIQNTVLGFTTHTHQISAVSQQQAATTQEITATMEKIKALAEELAKLSEELIS